MTLTLPYPPSNNRYYRHNRGVTHISEAGRAYRTAVLQARPRTGWPMLGRLAVRIDVYPQRIVSQDLDNVPKCICDALQNAKVYANDNQIEDLRIVRQPKVAQAHVVVTIEPI
jgi:crossover junction endodeoxyribonuclease RusA